MADTDMRAAAIAVLGGPETARVILTRTRDGVNRYVTEQERAICGLALHALDSDGAAMLRELREWVAAQLAQCRRLRHEPYWNATIIAFQQVVAEIDRLLAAKPAPEPAAPEPGNPPAIPDGSVARAEKAEAEVERLTGLLDVAIIRARIEAAGQAYFEARCKAATSEGEGEPRPSMIQLPYDALEDDWRAATVRALDTLDDRLEALEHAKEAGRASRARTELEAVRDLIDRGASSADTWNHIDARIAELRAQEARP